MEYEIRLIKVIGLRILFGADFKWYKNGSVNAIAIELIGK